MSEGPSDGGALLLNTCKAMTDATTSNWKRHCLKSPWFCGPRGLMCSAADPKKWAWSDTCGSTTNRRYLHRIWPKTLGSVSDKVGTSHPWAARWCGTWSSIGSSSNTLRRSSSICADIRPTEPVTRTASCRCTNAPEGTGNSWPRRTQWAPRHSSWAGTASRWRNHDTMSSQTKGRTGNATWVDRKLLADICRQNRNRVDRIFRKCLRRCVWIIHRRTTPVGCPSCNEIRTRPPADSCPISWSAAVEIPQLPADRKALSSQRPSRTGTS